MTKLGEKLKNRSAQQLNGRASASKTYCPGFDPLTSLQIQEKKMTDRRIFYVDVGDMTAEQAKAAIEKIKAKLKKK